MGTFMNTKLYQRMASVHNWLTELNNWLNELEMKGLFENFSSTESENSFFTRSHNVVEEISSCENFSHSRPSCGTLRNSISRTTGVMFIIFEAHQLVLWHIMGTNICWLGHRCLKETLLSVDFPVSTGHSSFVINCPWHLIMCHFTHNDKIDDYKNPVDDHWIMIMLLMMKKMIHEGEQDFPRPVSKQKAQRPQNSLTKVAAFK